MGLGVEFMSKRKKGYLELVIVLLIFLPIIFYFNLPKELLIIIGVVWIINLLVFEIVLFFKS